MFRWVIAFVLQNNIPMLIATTGINEAKCTDLSKKNFASGTLIAARYIIGKDNGIYKVGNLIE